MKKYLILLLMGILPYLSLAQNKVENSYLSVTVPPGWHVQKQDMPGTKMELLNFFNDGPILYNMGIIVGIEQIQNPKAALEMQMSIQNNPLFHNATFGEIHPATFMGKNTMSVDFSNTIDGINYNGAAYAFNENECTLLVIGCYKVGNKSNLPQIWRSITWKKHQRSASNYESLHEELQAYCKATNENLKKNPIISNGVKFVSLNVANDEDCLIYTYQLLNADKTKTTPESLQSAADNLRPVMLQEIKNLANNAEYVRRCMDSNYTFKYYYYDKNGNFLISITLKPEDYQ